MALHHATVNESGSFIQMTMSSLWARSASPI
jgi:hypothetical protein